MARSYVKAMLVSGLLMVASAAALNLVVDPYGIYRWVEVEGLNKRKPKSGPNSQVVKPYRVLEVRPATLILGNSRAEAGIDPHSPRWPPAARPVYNMALPGEGINAAWRALQHTVASAAPSQVVIGLDFFDYVFHDAPRRGAPPGPPALSDFDRRLLVNADGSKNGRRLLQQGKDHATVLLSLNTLTDTLQTVAVQRLGDQADLTELGFNPMHEFRRFVRHDGHHVMFRQVETTYLTNYLRVKYDLYVAGTGTSAALERLRALIALCRASGIRMVLFIHPAHAHVLEGYRIAGMWPLFEEWKRALVRVLEADSRAHPGAPPYALWDFSGYNEITTERVPTAAEKGHEMQWYWEAGHYKREVGELMLARMFGGGEEPAPPPAGFGVRLEPGNIESQLTAMRDTRRQYADNRKDEIEALEELGQAVMANLKRRKVGR